MICDIIERPGRWRAATLAVVTGLALAPTLPLVLDAIDEARSTAQTLVESGFSAALARSIFIAFAVAFASLVVGLPAGILMGLYDFPARRFFLAVMAIPFLVPSFLWAIGLSELRIWMGLPPESILSGWSGTALSFLAVAIPLVLYTAFLGARHLSKGQIEAARLVGGEALVFRQAARAAFAGAGLAAALAAILTIADPGPGQILGYSGAAYELLVSFSATFDFALATKQCVALASLVLLISIPIALFVAPNVAAGLLGRDVTPARLAKRTVPGLIALSLLVVIFSCFTILPLIGLSRPLLTNFPGARAFSEVNRTIGDTGFYALSAGLISTALGTILAIAVGHDKWLRRGAVAAVFVILSLPPSLSALGVIKLGTIAPAYLDPLLRSRFTVGWTSALRFAPVATVIMLRSFGSTSPSQCLVAAVHGVSLQTYGFRVLGPALLPAATLSCLIVALLSTAEVNTVLLLRPPGADSLPVQIFTVMANAPEALVAALCVLYIGGAVALLLAGWGTAALLEHHGRRV